MGQRLNIEIGCGHTIFANAYYHWSGFTKSAYDLAKKIIKVIKSEKYNKEDDLLYSIRLLEETGAGLIDNTDNDEYIEEAKKMYTSYGYLKALQKYQNSDMKLAKKIFEKENFKQCKGRNEGLISITEVGKQDTRDWEEGRITIDIDKNTINFDVFWIISDEELKDEEDYKDKEIVECDLDLENLTFDDFDKLENLIDDNLENLIKLKDGKIIQWIW